ncbi:MAG: hypothetical protein LBR25_08040 [Erysipelotrichaceae bacterium]|jgi:hypothetical protein|nr:hypothetical protein [Erysipelotrichaceae bacterium]
MKKAFDWLMEIKNFAAMAFAGLVMMYVVIVMIDGGDAIEVNRIWQILFVAMLIGFQRVTAFKEGPGTTKELIKQFVQFALPLYLGVTITALAGGWFAFEAKPMLLYTAGFIGFLALITAVYEVYFRVSHRSYNQLLKEYRQNHPW